MTVIVWFANDLRLQDQPALAAAARDGQPVIPLYILDEQNPYGPGDASRWWLHHSLAALRADIGANDGNLVLRRGATLEVIPELIEQTRATGVYFSRAHEPWLAEQQANLHRQLSAQQLACKRFAGRLLVEPEQVMTGQGRPFQVFTPFYRYSRKNVAVAPPHTAIPALRADVTGDRLNDWQLLPGSSDRASGFREWWQPGEQGAQLALNNALQDVMTYYAGRRDLPAMDGTSRLSPHLAFGEISPRQVWHAVTTSAARQSAATEPFVRQLYWREFSACLLHHWPHTVETPFRAEFMRFPWRNHPQQLICWQRGCTGYPLVDAGMRQLWETGWMHNRVRMVAASFLTKHLRMHWHHGAEWFRDTLVDVDLANNTAGWQWVAGCGADAAPYFRIFNPVLQGQKFDPAGEYVRTWVPELNNLPNRYIHQPWRAAETVLREAGIQLDRDYPMPVVDHALARTEALEAYAAMRTDAALPRLT